ncbi:MAG: LysM peptidoglycan-binding domain-containing protein [Calditrichaeota bacterium]|nr:MAG: LysM peptidoglycan-binding domain-containing protein [Calditrichota bacterium]
MNAVKSVFIVLLLSFVAAYAQNYSYNYEEMTQEQYMAELEKWKGRLATAEQGIADEDARIAQLKQELESLNQQIDQTWNEIYAIASSDKAGNDAYVAEINQLKNDVSAFLAMSPEDIYSRMNELNDFEAKVEELKKNDLSTLTANERSLNQVLSLINQAREKGKTAVPPSYTVERGDYLWKIAAKPDIYGDAYAWMRIYTSNADQIKDPDLIFPDQVLTIPRVVGPNEHLVQKGENLSMIAGYSNVYGSSFKWQKLFEANKSTISDPNVIYPYQVIKIER